MDLEEAIRQQPVTQERVEAFANEQLDRVVWDASLDGSGYCVPLIGKYLVIINPDRGLVGVEETFLHEVCHVVYQEYHPFSASKCSARDEALIEREALRFYGENATFVRRVLQLLYQDVLCFLDNHEPF